MNAPAAALTSLEVGKPAEPLATPVSPTSANIRYEGIPCGLTAPPKNPTGSMYHWLFAGGCIPALLLSIGCAKADTRVVASGYQTTKEGAARVPSSGPAHLVTAPAFYLVADDNAICEVDSTRYVTAKVGSRVVCEWSVQ